MWVEQDTLRVAPGPWESGRPRGGGPGSPSVEGRGGGRGEQEEKEGEMVTFCN